MSLQKHSYHWPCVVTVPVRSGSVRPTNHPHYAPLGSHADSEAVLSVAGTGAGSAVR